MSRFSKVQVAALTAILAITACGGDDGTGPPEPPEPPANRAPETVGTLGTVTIPVGGTVTVDVASNFRDPDGDELTYAATSSDDLVASTSVSGSRVDVIGVTGGTATLTVTARDPDGLTATQQLGGLGQRSPRVLTGLDPRRRRSWPRETSVDGRPRRPLHRPRRRRGELPGVESSDASVASVSVEGSTATITGVSTRAPRRVTFTLRDEFGQEGHAGSRRHRRGHEPGARRRRTRSPPRR